MDFFDHYRDTDIFCLQEIWSAQHINREGELVAGMVLRNKDIMTEGLQDITTLLQDHAPYFTPLIDNNYGLLILIKKEYKVVDHGEIWVYREKGYISKKDTADHARSIQYVTLIKDGMPFTVINFHGLWNGKGKGDSEDRIVQSEKILAFINSLHHDFVLVGDFNLLPDTQSIKLFENAGLKNLIKEYGIVSTRTSFYTKHLLHANYALVTKTIAVKDFKVLQEEVSDHAPLYLEI